MDIILDNNAFEQEIDDSVNFDQKKRRKSGAGKVRSAMSKVKTARRRLSSAKKQLTKARSQAKKMRKRC